MFKYKILKKGRKWYEGVTCDDKRYNAKILINDVSNSWTPGDSVSFEGDLEFKGNSKYGRQAYVTPHTISTPEDIEKAEQNKLKKMAQTWITNHPAPQKKRNIDWIRSKLYDLKDDEIKKEINDIEEESKKHRSKGTIWTQRYTGGWCSKCRKKFIEGQRVCKEYDYYGNKSKIHADCDVAEKETKAAEEKRKALTEKLRQEAPYNIGRGEGYGGHPYNVGDVIKHKDNYLVVVRSSSRYFSQDGMSFGVGDDRGHYYTAACREATEEEAAPLKAKEAQKVQRLKAAQRLKEITHMIIEKGTQPEGKNSVVGDLYFDDFNIYGSGKKFVVQSDKIWYIQNNGMDGDDWSYNNIRTGGAGAIGWYIPYDESLVKELNELKKIMNQ